MEQESGYHDKSFEGRGSGIETSGSKGEGASARAPGFRLAEVTGGAAPSSCYALQVGGVGLQSCRGLVAAGGVRQSLIGCGVRARPVGANPSAPAGWWGRRTGAERAKTATSAGEGPGFGSSVQ